LNTVTLQNANTANPTFVAPLVGTFDLLEFEVSVSDGTSPAETDTVEISVIAAPAGTLTGTVRDSRGSAVAGATVSVVRSDGQRATDARTNGAGQYTISDVRVGSNTISVSAPGFESEVRDVTLTSGQSRTENFTLSSRSTVLEGSVRFSNGSAAAGADIEVLDGSGTVLSSARTDSAGEYRITDLDRTDVANGRSIRIRHPNAAEWNVTVRLNQGVSNRHDFRYGTLQVTVTGRGRGVSRRLTGTFVEILVGDQVIASNTTTRRSRKLTFQNVPATLVKIRATNPSLAATQTETTVSPGPRAHRVTIQMRARGGF
jgi:hypothetical protein